MSDVTQSELLINALLDGQLDADEAKRVSKQIAEDEQLSQMLAAFTRQRAAIAELPQYKLKDRFADRVLEIAAAEAAARPMLDRPPASSVDWKKYAMTLAAIAGLLMGMLVYQWTPLSRQDGPTVAVRSFDAKPPSAKDQVAALPAVDNLNEEGDQSSSAAPSWKNSELAKASPPSSQAPVAIDSMAGAPMRSRSATSSDALGGMGASAPAKAFAKDDTKRFSNAAPAPELPPSGDFSFSGTPMASPQNQSQPAIDQVWLLEVNERFSQGQLLEALTSNSISVPPELEQSPAVTLNTNENVQPKDVDGIHVAAKALQMKNALSQLSQSDAVTISAFHLPGDLAKQAEADKNLMASKKSGAPLSIVPPQKAIAQKLRGNFFAQQAPLPSSMVPESFDKLEKKMGITTDGTNKVTGDQFAGQEPVSDEADMEVAAQPTSEMEQLFPGNTLESDRLQNFLILIRNNAPTKK